MRVGGLDIVFNSLAQQSFTDFELVISDGVYKYRKDEIEEIQKLYPFKVRHVDPIDNPFPLNNFCRYSNTALIHANSEVVLFITDYSWLPPDCVKTHALFHKANGINVGLIGPNQYRSLSELNPRFPRYQKDQIDQYASDVKSGRLDDFKWSILNQECESIDSFLIDPLVGNDDPKLFMPMGSISSIFFHAKNESCKLTPILSINGWDEDLDGALAYQDSDIADRLTSKIGIQWTHNPSNIIHVVNPNIVFPSSNQIRSHASNEEIWQKKKNSGYPSVNNWNLKETREQLKKTREQLKKTNQTQSITNQTQLVNKKLRCAFFFPPSQIRATMDMDNIWTADRGLTGSEMTFVMYALEMARRGHWVTAFTGIIKPTNLERVVCCNYDDWASTYKDQHWDALCSWMTPEPLKIANSTQFRLFDQQVTDFSLCEPGWESYVDILTPVSHSHANFMKPTTNFPIEKWRILYNGVNTADFKLKEKIPGKMIWASSHDRGLHWVLESFPKIKKAVPHATLHIFYNFSGLEGFARLTNATGFMAELCNRSRYTLEAIRRLEGKGVYTYKSVSRQRIQEEMATSEILAYPCDPVRYTEAFGVTVLEACAAGTVPVICTADAFAELWGGVGLNVPPPFPQHKDEYVEKLIHVLKNSKSRKLLSEGCIEYAKKFEWSTLVTDLEKCLLTRGQEGLSLVKWESK
jgi:glycosyltransferase involved in cell wall biosynthesis